MIKPYLIAVGDNCLDVYLTGNELTIGGNALNVAVQWYNLGAHARYFGAVGQDKEADFVLGAIEKAGLDVRDVEICDGSTAITLIANEAGERRFLFESLGVGEAYFPCSSHYQKLADCDFVHLGTRANPKLVHRLTQDKIRFSIDLSNLPFEDYNLTGAELIFASAGEESENIAPLLAAIKQKGGRKILLTCGAQGSYYHDGEQLLHTPARDIAVMDTCGAGDGFLACFVLAMFFEGLEPYAALVAATDHAAKICAYQGGFIQSVQPIPDWLHSKYSCL